MKIYDYKTFFENKLKELAKGTHILDVGGGSPFQKAMSEYKEIFQGKRFQTLDIAPEYKPDIVGDIHNMPIRNESIDGVLCLSVLEHVHDPARAVAEIHRILRQGGKTLIYTHFIYPYHARPGIYEDYFRFTEHGLRELFKHFSKIEIKKQGGYFRAMFFFMPGQALLKPVWEPIAYVLDKLFQTEKRSTTCGFYVYAIK